MKFKNLLSIIKLSSWQLAMMIIILVFVDNYIRIFTSYLYRDIHFIFAFSFYPLISVFASFLALKITNEYLASIACVGSFLLIFLFIDNYIINELCSFCITAVSSKSQPNIFFFLLRLSILLISSFLTIFNILTNKSKKFKFTLFSNFLLFLLLYSVYTYLTC